MLTLTADRPSLARSIRNMVANLFRNAYQDAATLDKVEPQSTKQPAAPIVAQFGAEYTAPKKNQGGRPCKYPWPEMRVGGSFFVPGKTTIAMSNVARNASIRNNAKYVCRAVDGGVRVWRTA